MAAITFLMSSLARLRVSARTDRPDMAAAGAAGAGALLPRHGESRASRAAARPPQQRHSGSLPLRARVREEARAPTRLLGLKASARLRAPPRASLPRRPGSPLRPGPPRRPGCAAARRHVLLARRGARRYRWGSLALKWFGCRHLCPLARVAAITYALCT